MVDSKTLWLLSACVVGLAGKKFRPYGRIDAEKRQQNTTWLYRAATYRSYYVTRIALSVEGNGFSMIEHDKFALVYPRIGADGHIGLHFYGNFPLLSSARGTINSQIRLGSAKVDHEG